MTTHPDGRRARGDQTRGRILREAGEVASLNGLNGLSLAQLGEALDLSKSGVHALFGTKEELQLETVAAARQRFVDVVILPVLDEPKGLIRFRALIKAWIAYIRNREFPGGCFVTRFSVEFASQPGRVRDAIIEVRNEWLQFLESELSRAQQAGDLASSCDPAQLAFEIDALLVAGNNGFLLGDQAALTRAAAGVENRLAPAQP
jgi:AcrR family transcriptional regulator